MHIIDAPLSEQLLVKSFILSAAMSVIELSKGNILCDFPHF
jgi:hypothetical protein